MSMVSMGTEFFDNHPIIYILKRRVARTLQNHLSSRLTTKVVEG